MEITPRAKFGYLSYNDMLQKVQEEVLDAYDICYTKDTNECYIIKEDLIPSPIRSKVYVFQSETNAIEQINQNTDTYNGQIIAVLDGDTYRGYIVNQKNDKFTVTPLWEHPEPIDYDTLGNRPIINLEGTFDNTIVVSELDTGIYSIKGQYKIYESEVTTYSTGSNIIFIVDKNKNSVKIKKITSQNIIDYLISDNSVSSNQYITTDYLKDYATTDYVDVKIEALQKSITEDMKSYVEKIVQEQFGTILDEKIESKIGEILVPINDSEIEGLFI